MHWWKKFLSNFFSEKKIDEPEELQIENKQKNEHHEMKTRMIYQYPKGEFRFPLIKDNSESSKPAEERQSRPYNRRQEGKAREPKTSRPVQGSHTKPVSAERKIIEPKIRQPFQPTHTPSPIYGFNRPSDKKEKSSIPEFELTELKSESLNGKEKPIKENSRNYIGNINKEAVFKGNMKLQKEPGKVEETKTLEIKTWRGNRYEENNADSETNLKEGVSPNKAEGFSGNEGTSYQEEDTVFAGNNKGEYPADLPVESAMDTSNVPDLLPEGTSEPEILKAAVTETVAKPSSVMENEESAVSPVVVAKNTRIDSEFLDVLPEGTSEPEISKAAVTETQAALSSELENGISAVSPVDVAKNIRADSEVTDVLSERVSKSELEAPVNRTDTEPSSEMEIEQSTDSSAKADIEESFTVPDVVSEKPVEPQLQASTVENDAFPASEVLLEPTEKAGSSIPDPEPEMEQEKESTNKGKPRQHLPFNVLMLSQDRTKWQKQKQRERDKQKRESIPETNAKAAEAEIAATSDSPSKYFEFPALQLLKPPVIKEENTEWLNEQTALLDETMENFNVKARVVNASQGPSVTRFEVQPDKGVKVNKITNLSNDIKLSMAARDIRMEAPIPGTRSIGIELPNKESRPVQISEIIGKEAFLQAESPLTAALGLDISGEPIVTDLRKMPHGLIAGATGSGKSVCINSILVSLLYKARPDELKLLLIDPKMVELAPYNHIPHLVSPVITDVKAATAALKWAVDEMERRYELFVHAGVRDISRFNYLAETKGQKSEHLPYVVIVIDELADLMMVAPAEVEESICRIAQKARACGIHLLIATQRPSVDVITGLIKANVPTRIAFAVSSQVDSRTVIDVSGAEKLLGRGDMLFLNNGSVKPVRLQGTFVSDEEIDRVIEHVRSQGEPNYLFQQEELLKKAEMQENEDELLLEACEFVVKQGNASTSLLQRHFRIGYNRAARLMEMMEDQGVISGAKGSKPRDVLIKEAELDLLKDSLVH